MKIEHIAIYVKDLEKAREFFEKYFGGKANDGYHNLTTDFRSYFISFEDGSRLELMNKPTLIDYKKDLNIHAVKNFWETGLKAFPLMKEEDEIKIYLTEEDYLEDLSAQAAQERRETQPVVESEYIFNAVPETEKAVYFFDERQRPKVPGQPNAADYKREKRLWNKPKRYSPDEYYGMQGAADTTESSSYSEESSYGDY